ncbi:SSU ribosomal protein S6P modification protein [Humidesulfovibrio mexicanus]|uniref:SSU ribosomal protein S6P modification protein n=1 Tax=Humidesulfovibrio mexicanus TaxID=147047 RepID=A0A239C3E3_9BACT|nr:GAK system ATP-grasp enzyme [Humidesulfovibrio mexicanus]SNS14422.1 SSU ribosomal protein S6P modification protein [Humidesulfovibrio mexicanus]
MTAHTNHSAPRLAVVGVRGGWSSDLLARRAAEATGCQPLVIELERLSLDLGTGRALYEGLDLSRCGGLLLKKLGPEYSPGLLDRLEMLRFLEGRGVRMFSRPGAVAGLLDRLACTTTMVLGGVPMPPTTVTEDLDAAQAAVEAYGEAVLKPLYSTKARGMMVLRPGPGLRAALEGYLRAQGFFYIQKTVVLGERDLGVVFLGGQYLTTYSRRRQPGAWNTTTASGGRYEPFDPPREVVDLAWRAQNLFGLDFTCVDVALTDNGPQVFEVSAFGGFRGILEARGLDAAQLYAEYAAGRIDA